MGLKKRLRERWNQIESCLCIGIDPDIEDVNNFRNREKENNCVNIKKNIKEDGLDFIEEGKSFLLKEYGTFDLAEDEEFFYFFHHFCFFIINTTRQYALAYKMNFGFFILHGSKGVDVLKNVFLYLKHLNIPTILDMKVNDIGNTLSNYRTFIFDYLQSDICTVNIYMGADILKNICYDELKNKYHSAYVLIKTTNPGSFIFQNELQVDDKKAFVLMAEEATKISDQLNMESNGEFIGFVVGANSYNEMSIIRKRFPDCYILVPGVGAQQGDLQKCLANGFTKNCEKILINVGRGITKSESPSEAARSFYEMISNIIKPLL